MDSWLQVIVIIVSILLGFAGILAQLYTSRKNEVSQAKALIKKLGKFEETSIDAVIGVSKGEDSLRKRIDIAAALSREINERTKKEESRRESIDRVGAAQTVEAVSRLAEENGALKSALDSSQQALFIQTTEAAKYKAQVEQLTQENAALLETARQYDRIIESLRNPPPERRGADEREY